MRKYLAVAAAMAVAVGGFAQVSSAVEVTKPVQAFVQGMIKASGVTATQVGSPEIGLGTVSIPVSFRVDANTESVLLTALATDLFKADQTNGIYIIKTNGPGVLVEVVASDNQFTPAVDLLAGSCVQNCLDLDSDNKDMLAWDDLIAVVDGFRSTATGLFESAHAGHFSHDLIFTVSWGNENAELPMGFYSGQVRMVAAMGPF
jgi:hypothetical protein